jgi:NADH:ubiquinone oxidoreductase subunit E
MATPSAVRAPMCQVDDKAYHENLTPEKMDQIIDELSLETRA